MQIPIILTKPGMGIDEGTLTQWLFADGDRVTSGAIVAEVETAKAVQEIEAPADGILRIRVEPGEVLAVNAELGSIETDPA